LDLEKNIMTTLYTVKVVAVHPRKMVELSTPRSNPAKVVSVWKALCASFEPYETMPMSYQDALKRVQLEFHNGYDAKIVRV